MNFPRPRFTFCGVRLFLFQECIDKIFYVFCVGWEKRSLDGDYEIMAREDTIFIVSVEFLGDLC